MRKTTTDPMTLNDVDDLDKAPFVIEGEGEQAIKIYDDDCLLMPEQLRRDNGNAYRMFTPFWRKAQALLATRVQARLQEETSQAATQSADDRLEFGPPRTPRQHQ